MSDYKQDPNDSKKQVPGSLPKNAFTRTGVPANCTMTKSPNYILFNTAMNDEFGFFFGTSASFAENATNDGATDISSTVMTSSARYEKFAAGVGAVGTKLDLHPTAVSSSAQDVGFITFIYKGGLDGSGRP